MSETKNVLKDIEEILKEGVANPSVVKEDDAISGVDDTVIDFETGAEDGEGLEGEEEETLAFWVSQIEDQLTPEFIEQLKANVQVELEAIADAEEGIGGDDEEESVDDFDVEEEIEVTVDPDEEDEVKVKEDVDIKVKEIDGEEDEEKEEK